MNDMLMYRERECAVADACIASCQRHLWYITPQLLPMILCDDGTEPEMRESVAKRLLSIPRHLNIQPGKPTFPHIEVVGNQFHISKTMLNEKSWLLFNLLKFSDEDMKWLDQPHTEWEAYPGYTKLFNFVNNMKVVNDIAERGIKLISDFANKCTDEQQRQSLLQVVEFHRNEFKDYTKKTLRNINC